MILYQNTCHLNDESAAEVNTEIDCNNFTCDYESTFNATSFGVALFTHQPIAANCHMVIT